MLGGGWEAVREQGGEVGPLLLEHPGWALAWGAALGVSGAELFWRVEADAVSGVHRGILLWEQALEPVPAQPLRGDPRGERDQLIRTSVSI